MSEGNQVIDKKTKQLKEKHDRHWTVADLRSRMHVIPCNIENDNIILKTSYHLQGMVTILW